MKTTPFLFALILCLATATMHIHAQTKLPDSPKGSTQVHIYSVDRDNLRKIHRKGHEATEDMLGQYITHFPTGQDAPELPRGNYLTVKALGNKLNVSDYTVDDLYFKVVPAEEMRLCLHDSLGNMITDATVRCGGKTLKYDKTTQTYNTQNIADGQVIEVNNNGVYHYIEVEKRSYHYQARKKKNKNKYTGFVVFSKPRFKPGETVKFKAYMAELDGKPYNKPVDIRLYAYYPHKVDTVLTNIKPYRPGMYEYQFDLTDKLNLTLDVNYTIELKTDNERHNSVNGRFRYEDYELKGIRFAMNTDKLEYAQGDSVKLKFKVTDENEMAVYDGQIELLVKSLPITYQRVKSHSSGFVLDTLWTHTLLLDGALDREIILPDSIFPDITIDYEVKATYLSSDNEKKTAQKQLTHLTDKYAADARSIRKMNDEPIGCRFYRSNDSIHLKVDNPTEIPFWYEIRKDKKRIRHGYATDALRLTYSAADKGQHGYSVQLVYLPEEGRAKTIERSLPFIQKNISMDVSTPTTVYPGQKTDVQITVTDKKGKPVSDVDITAYAYTSKFEDSSTPPITIRAKSKYARTFNNTPYRIEESTLVNHPTSLTWSRWKSIMALDTVAYYNFLYPENYYLYTEPTADGSTLISPYIVIDGAVQEVHTLWIDNRLYYTSLAGQRDNYTFPIEPGKHTLRFRTYDREISVHYIFITEGTRNIFSFNAAPAYVKLPGMNDTDDFPLVISSGLLDKKEHGLLTDKEITYLAEQLITVDNNFGVIRLPNLRNTLDIPAYIKSGDRYYYLNHTPRTQYNKTLRGSVNMPVLAGPFPKRTALKGLIDAAAVYSGESWEGIPFNRSIGVLTEAHDFRETPLTVDDIRQHSNEQLLSLLKSSYGPAEARKRYDQRAKAKTGCRLNLYFGNDPEGKILRPALVFIVPTRPEELSNYSLYYGGTRNFTALPAGDVNVSLIFNDSTSCTLPITLRQNGQNFLHFDSIPFDAGKETARIAFNLLNKGITRTYSTNPYNVKPTTQVGSISTISMDEPLQGQLGGLWVRGISTFSSSEKPLIIVNGLPFEGDINELDPSVILSFKVLKDGSATAIYGSRGANGVIIIQTNNAVTVPNQAQPDGTLQGMEAGNTMRRNFHDDAFWQPRLTTDNNGQATFQVTYPDDITSWDAHFIAVGTRKQTDKKKMTIRSFKALVASLSTPRFAVRGDSLDAVGKITNHLGDSISVDRSIQIDSQVQKENLTLATTHVDYIPAIAESGDSLTIAYSMQMANGYFDGEERSFPIIEQGMLQTHGDFRVLNDTTTATFTLDPALGAVTIHAEASSLELFLREIEKVDSYPYLCNEQMASKIKVLLSKKQIAEMFDKPFKEEKKIKSLINRLNKNKNREGLWGWWNQSSTERWISAQVISALLDAEAADYKTDLDIPSLQYDLTKELTDALGNLRLSASDKLPHARRELMDRLITLKRLNAPMDYAQYFKQIDLLLPVITLTDKLKTMEAQAAIGLANQINVDSLMHYSSRTMLGSLCWGETKDVQPLSRHFILPYNNPTDNTLSAYRILRAIGGHEKEMEQVRNYFFERRQGGSWANTYESSRIIETIMPDLLTPEQRYTETSMTIDGSKITQFPYTVERASTHPIHISKEGTMPVFVTVYQQAWNPRPLPESDKGFLVKTVFKANGDTISSLTAGKTAQLEVAVTVESAAEYVQIEVPIPAGCSYDSKHQGRSFWNDAHREYFKDKVVIFSNKLSVGTHRFVINLIPRFTGRYSLNPAKVELMYFPVFYGNEEMKGVEIGRLMKPRYD